MKANFNCCCVLVTYNPDLTLFKSVRDKVRGNVSSLIIVDNGSLNISEIIDIVSEDLVIELGVNLGIAHAQNVGIARAKELGFNYVWFSDQDTLYPAGFLRSMFSYIEELETSNIKYAAVGPSFFDMNRKTLQPFVRINNGFEYFSPEPGVNECSHLISSGMIVPVNALDVIGLMRSDFFIDLVDFEWCWRALDLGWKIIGIGEISIDHRIGEETKKIFGKELSIRSPFRHYYIIRNSTYLFFYYKGLSFRCRLRVLYQALSISVVALIFGVNRLQYVKAISTGFFSGLIGRLTSNGYN